MLKKNRKIKISEINKQIDYFLTKLKILENAAPSVKFQAQEDLILKFNNMPPITRKKLMSEKCEITIEENENSNKFVLTIPHLAIFFKCETLFKTFIDEMASHLNTDSKNLSKQSDSYSINCYTFIDYLLLNNIELYNYVKNKIITRPEILAHNYLKLAIENEKILLANDILILLKKSDNPTYQKDIHVLLDKKTVPSIIIFLKKAPLQDQTQYKNFFKELIEVSPKIFKPYIGNFIKNCPEYLQDELIKHLDSFDITQLAYKNENEDVLGFEFACKSPQHKKFLNYFLEKLTTYQHFECCGQFPLDAPIHGLNLPGFMKILQWVDQNKYNINAVSAHEVSMTIINSHGVEEKYKDLQLLSALDSAVMCYLEALENEKKASSTIYNKMIPFFKNNNSIIHYKMISDLIKAGASLQEIKKNKENEKKKHKDIRSIDLLSVATSYEDVPEKLVQMLIDNKKENCQHFETDQYHEHPLYGIIKHKRADLLSLFIAMGADFRVKFLPKKPLLNEPDYDVYNDINISQILSVAISYQDEKIISMIMDVLNKNPLNKIAPLNEMSEIFKIAAAHDRGLFLFDWKEQLKNQDLGLLIRILATSISNRQIKNTKFLLRIIDEKIDITKLERTFIDLALEGYIGQQNFLRQRKLPTNIPNKNFKINSNNNNKQENKKESSDNDFFHISTENPSNSVNLEAVHGKSMNPVGLVKFTNFLLDYYKEKMKSPLQCIKNSFKLALSMGMVDIIESFVINYPELLTESLDDKSKFFITAPYYISCTNQPTELQKNLITFLVSKGAEIDQPITPDGFTLCDLASLCQKNHLISLIQKMPRKEGKKKPENKIQAAKKTITNNNEPIFQPSTSETLSAAAYFQTLYGKDGIPILEEIKKDSQEKREKEAHELKKASKSSKTRPEIPETREFKMNNQLLKAIKISNNDSFYFLPNTTINNSDDQFKKLSNKPKFDETHGLKFLSLDLSKGCKITINDTEFTLEHLLELKPHNTEKRLLCAAIQTIDINQAPLNVIIPIEHAETGFHTTKEKKKLEEKFQKNCSYSLTIEDEKSSSKEEVQEFTKNMTDLEQETTKNQEPSGVTFKL